MAISFTLSLTVFFLASCDVVTDSDELTYDNLSTVGTHYFPIVEGLHTRTSMSTNGGEPAYATRDVGSPTERGGVRAWPVTDDFEGYTVGIYPLTRYYAEINDTLNYYSEMNSTWLPLAGVIAMEAASRGDTILQMEEDSMTTWSVLASEDDVVTVPTGTYHCVMVYTTSYLNDPNLTFTDSTVTRNWYAPGVGRVKSISSRVMTDSTGTREWVTELLLVEFRADP